MDADKPLRDLGVGSQEAYTQVFNAIRCRKVFEASEPELEEYLRSLCDFHAGNVGQDQTSASLLLHHLLLCKALSRVSEGVEQSRQTMLTIDQSNRRTNTLVVALAIIAICVGLLQVWAQLGF